MSNAHNEDNIAENFDTISEESKNSKDVNSSSEDGGPGAQDLYTYLIKQSNYPSLTSAIESKVMVYKKLKVVLKLN
jgi:hypothetical protein